MKDLKVGQLRPVRRKRVGSGVSLLAVAFMFALLLPCSGWQARLVAAESLAVTAESVRIPVASDISLTVRIFRPVVQSDTASPLPTIVLVSPWSVGAIVYEYRARYLASAGYLVLAYNSRGWAGSDGEVDSAGPNDVADFRKVLDWLVAEQGADPFRIGAGGISLGAGTALVAAAFEPRVRAVVSMSGWSDLFVSVFGNDTERFVWGRILNLAGQLLGGRFNQAWQQQQKQALLTRDAALLRQYTDPRSPQTYLDAYAEHQTAILISHNISDFLFPLNDVLNFYDKLATPKALTIQPGIHASAEVVELAAIGDRVWGQARQWFDHYLLRPLPTGYEIVRGLAEQRISILARDGETLVQGDGLADLSRQSRAFQLVGAESGESYGRLAESVDEAEPNSCCDEIQFAYYSGAHSGVPILYPLLRSYVERPTIRRLSRLRSDRAFIYRTPSLANDTVIAGIPKLSFYLESSADSGQLVAYLYRERSDRQLDLLSLVPYSYDEVEPNKPFPVHLQFFSGFQQLAAGDRLVVVMDTFDLQFSPVNTERFRLRIRTDLASELRLGFW